MKVIHLSYSDIGGGAARAAYRIHKTLLTGGINSLMWVNKKQSDDDSVNGPQSRREKIMAAAKPFLGSMAKLTYKTTNQVIHSPAILPSKWASRINASDADVVHLHWINGEMLSIADIGKIKKHIIWNLHDMWPFCGAEHYTDDDRWKYEYSYTSRRPGETGFDLNRWTWQRKNRHWKRPMHIVANSRWLEESAKESSLFNKWNARTIHYPLNMSTWAPINKPEARDLLGIPRDGSLIVFGAIRGTKDPRKGFDLLSEALKRLKDQPIFRDLRVIVFGQSMPQQPPDIGFPIHFTGHLHDDLSLRIVYSAADALIVPSRQEAFGQIALEAHACGTPVIAFRIGGLSDIVTHGETGYLAEPFKPEDLARGISWVLVRKRSGTLGMQARIRATTNFNNAKIAEEYRQLYQEILADQDGQ